MAGSMAVWQQSYILWLSIRLQSRLLCGNPLLENHSSFLSCAVCGGPALSLHQCCNNSESHSSVISSSVIRVDSQQGGSRRRGPSRQMGTISDGRHFCCFCSGSANCVLAPLRLPLSSVLFLGQECPALYLSQSPKPKLVVRRSDSDRDKQSSLTLSSGVHESRSIFSHCRKSYYRRTVTQPSPSSWAHCLHR